MIREQTAREIFSILLDARKANTGLRFEEHQMNVSYNYVPQQYNDVDIKNVDGSPGANSATWAGPRPFASRTRPTPARLIWTSACKNVLAIRDDHMRYESNVPEHSWRITILTGLSWFVWEMYRATKGIASTRKKYHCI